MSHTPLPWRITEPTERKTREIVGAGGETVAKLTALDMDNAKRIVASVNTLATNAIEQFKEHAGTELDQETPLERLRYFCSLAMTNGNDWLDSEPFFDALEAQLAKAPA